MYKKRSRSPIKIKHKIRYKSRQRSRQRSRSPPKLKLKIKTSETNQVTYNTIPLEPSHKNVVKYNQAYVWLIMKGDRYLPGIFTSLHSIKRTIPKDKNLVVMVTPDVSEQAINVIKLLADYVARVEYLEHTTNKMRTERQEELYSSWISLSYTKWQSLRLPFDKILFLDADVIALDTIDQLFDMQTPASPFSSPFQKPLGLSNNYYLSKGELGKDGYPKNGAIMSKEAIARSLFMNGSIATATSILLEPSIYHFNKMWNMLKTQFPKGFGFSSCNSGADEQLISYYYSIYALGPETNWINIHQRYNYIPWKKGFLVDEMPLILHFFSNVKPWEQKVDEWIDVINWYVMFIDGIIDHKLSIKNFPGVKIIIKGKTYDKLSDIIYQLKHADESYIRDFTKKFSTIGSCLDLIGKIYI